MRGGFYHTIAGRNDSTQVLKLMNTEESAVVLIVDDDENQRWMVKKYLEKYGFDVKTAENGVVMREQLAKYQVDLVLLDVTMPGEDGFALARHLREHYKLGIIMLTAAAELFDRVLGLEIGADDYITKPFEPRELMARVKAVLRRISDKGVSQQGVVPGKAGESVAFGKYVFCGDSRELRDANGELVVLTSMEFDLLKVFAENPGRVLTRDNLLNIAHNREWDPFDRSVDNRIARLRRKIEEDPTKPEILKTVRGVGYIFVEKQSG